MHLNHVITKLHIPKIILGLFMIAFTGGQLWAQDSLKLSKNRDFKTEDQVFSRDDTMFILVTAPDIDFTDIEKNEFRLKPDDGGNDFEGKFKNNFDGTYQAKIDLSSADPEESEWELRVRIEDEGGREFRARVEVQILKGEGGEEVEVTGVIQSIDLVDSTLVVEDITFEVTAGTEIFDDDDRPIAFSDLSEGLVVKIRGIRVGESILATRIKIDIDLEDDEIKVTGTVAEVGDDFLIVAGFIFKVNESTEILDENEEEIPLSKIKVGFIVEVRADVLPDETLLATKIEIEDRFEVELVITGVIQSISLDDSVLVVAGFEFIITDSTVILDEDNNSIDFGDLQVGAVVEIRADVQADGTLIATRIEVEDRFEDKVELTGTIESIGSGSSGDTLVVAGITFFVDANTEISNNEDNPIGFADLMVGLIVEIRGIVQQDGKFVATRIKIKDRIEDEVEVTGVIEQITETSEETTITVLGRTFVLTDNTVILDENDTVINLSMLFVGQTVEIRGDLLSDGTLIALRIKIEDREANEIEVEGPIDSFGSSGPKTLEVIGIIFFVTDTTQILDEENNSISFDELQLGQTVEVRAVGQPNGTRVATRIKVEDVLLLSGVVENVVSNGISMLGKEVLFDANTLVLGKLNRFLSIEDLAVGQFVEVRATDGNADLIFGTKVKIQGTSVITSIPDFPEDPVKPNDFVLLQNYPNPFNPSTTISFAIPESAKLVSAQLTIFNLLGQKIRTLLNRPLTSGTYQRQWDGLDDKGNALPTGVYIYQLKAGAVSKTERMLLIK